MSAHNRPMMRSIFSRACATLVVVMATGCASGGGGDTMVDKALQLVGLSKPTPPETPVKDLAPPVRKVTLRLHAGDVLNTDATGRSLSAVARIYKLRDSAAFLQAPYEAFRDAAAGKNPAIEQDVVEAREVVLTPGQHYEVVETVPAQASFVGVVVLFRAPAESRWRFVFDTKAAAAGGVTLGVHGCALSVAQGQPVASTPEAMRVAGVRCL
jgi:type VI secretion system protein VasD